MFLANVPIQEVSILCFHGELLFYMAVGIFQTYLTNVFKEVDGKDSAELRFYERDS
jgi:hypothetical protein